MPDLSRRDFVITGTAAIAALTASQAIPVHAFPSQPGEEVIPWLDQPPANPVPDAVANQLQWEQLNSWLTPNDKFFSIAHYNRPVIDAETWKLEVGGLVKRPQAFTLKDLMARPRQEVVFTLECSGNHGHPWFLGGIGTAKWVGTPLAAVLAEAGVLENGIEVVFFGADAGEEIVSALASGPVKRDIKMRQHFARSMSLADAMNPDNLLCYEMNGAPLPPPNGFPMRLIAPGWYGIANIKWLTRIEVRPRRLMNRYMARDYVTIRKETRDGETVWTETSVGRALLKSVAAKVTRKNGQFRIIGAAWGAPIDRVDVRIDQGPWQPATIDRSEQAKYAWTIWSLDWKDPLPGEHSITARAIDTTGQMQPAMDDPQIANKHTYWESNGQVTRRIRM
ncbi:sulfite oxidase [Mesorhizobium sp. L-8-3]|uniref:sulfite oxidase n=1 Tax=Mesorhizobium sp. L-8-3 TaxID=2744522 RepID=UPI0019254E17|nr:sulfite oxidase [Mesorhizobium sp. L-8-3]BCH25974.1 sulfite oxidase [Mesorhizobium sp. L-8-3]